MKYTCEYCDYLSDSEVCDLCHRPTTKDRTGFNVPVKVIAPPEKVPALPDVQVGRTTVNVWKKDVDERTGHERILKLHEGVVIQELVGHTSRFLRVFNPAPLDKGGDISPERSQLYAFSAPRVWVEIVGTLNYQFPALV